MHFSQQWTVLFSFARPSSPIALDFESPFVQETTIYVTKKGHSSVGYICRLEMLSNLERCHLYLYKNQVLLIFQGAELYTSNFNFSKYAQQSDVA